MAACVTIKSKKNENTDQVLKNCWLDLFSYFLMLVANIALTLLTQFSINEGDPGGEPNIF